MSAPKNPQRFAEIERLMSDYFSCHIAPVMKQTKDYLGNKQAEEMRDYSTSTAGILSSLASANMPGGDPYATLKYTGKWNSKTTEDYLAMCKEHLQKDTKLQNDLAVMAKEWRTAVIGQVGRAKYDQLSKTIGCDLAYAYLDHRMEELMIDKMVKDRMPKSSADYIIKRAAESSLFGLPQVLRKTELDNEIDRRGEAAYKPSKKEKIAGTAIGSLADGVALGGAGSWSSLAKFVGIDLAISGAMSMMEKPNGKATTVEDCISQGVFGSKTDVFSGFRKSAKAIKIENDVYIKQVNEQLNHKTPTTNYFAMDWNKINNTWTPTVNFPTGKRDEKYKDVPMIVAPGKEEEYLKAKAATDAQRAKEAKEAEEKAKTENLKKVREKTGNSQTTQSTEQPTEQTSQQSSALQPREQSPETTNSNGWDSLLGNVADGLGLGGFGNVMKNFGYVLSMLPDVLVGLFTGKTTAFSGSNSLLPIASIVAGMFVKNPLLKMLLVGVGGMNLLNKAGHEVLGNQQRDNSQSTGAENAQVGVSQTQYRHYADEALNPRIGNPILQGGCIIANIDKVPCTIQVPDAVVEAHQSGALPLNTLANAVLAKYDQQRGMDAQMMASRNFAQEQNERETIVRSRGIQ